MERGEINPTTGVTNGDLRSKCRSVLRKMWRETSRKEFLKRVRVAYKGAGRSKYAVICEGCSDKLGFSEKKLFNKVDGTPRKNKTLVYQVDHIDGCHELLNMERDLGKYAQSLIFGELRILCYKCHLAHTKKQQTKIRNKK